MAEVSLGDFVPSDHGSVANAALAVLNQQKDLALLCASNVMDMWAGTFHNFAKVCSNIVDNNELPSMSSIGKKVRGLNFYDVKDGTKKITLDIVLRGLSLAVVSIASMAVIAISFALAVGHVVAYTAASLCANTLYMTASGAWSAGVIANHAFSEAKNFVRSYNSGKKHPSNARVGAADYTENLTENLVESGARVSENSDAVLKINEVGKKPPSIGDLISYAVSTALTIAAVFAAVSVTAMVSPIVLLVSYAVTAIRAIRSSRRAAADQYNSRMRIFFTDAERCGMSSVDSYSVWSVNTGYDINSMINYTWGKEDARTLGSVATASSLDWDSDDTGESLLCSEIEDSCSVAPYEYTCDEVQSNFGPSYRHVQDTPNALCDPAIISGIKVEKCTVALFRE